VRFGLSATAAAAVLYGAVILFGLGPAPPSALGRNDDRSASVVRVPHDPAVSGPVQRGPQPSTGPARQSSRRPRREPVVERVGSPRDTKAAPDRPTDGPRAPVSTPAALAPSPSPSPSQQSPQQEPALLDTTLLEVTAPAPLPEVPEVNVPTLPLPALPPLPPPPSLPEAPSVPALP
jgi:hypothetical protein